MRSFQRNPSEEDQTADTSKSYESNQPERNVQGPQPKGLKQVDIPEATLFGRRLFQEEGRSTKNQVLPKQHQIETALVIASESGHAMPKIDLAPPTYQQT